MFFDWVFWGDPQFLKGCLCKSANEEPKMFSDTECLSYIPTND